MKNYLETSAESVGMACPDEDRLETWEKSSGLLFSAMLVLIATVALPCAAAIALGDVFAARHAGRS